ncbi:twin-arginine translocase subunit TatC [Phytoactinopolyspora halotolerans]|uniref:Sec-independent protein translocase protein TatC n=1 Tax=Phytoactinopolyspora halotolerans TaxID=1981512 RepID=A0A6L9SDF9_9ACTN|nr:twin-arginine translocase subunit TatC [Phytoactinopolyspora halotolerans]NEE03173.1 twin-arginine translocase subunit TatC [Phytoactinopolyspora halotolerans]
MATIIGRRGKGSRPERDPEGRMTLTEHLRELRSRLFKSALAVLLFGIIGFVFHEQIMEFLLDPMLEAAERTGADARPTYQQATDPLIVPMTIAMWTGVMLGAPVWIYQIWGFITPALYANEKKWALAVVGAAVPMFAAGVVLALWVMPKAWEFLLNFTPDDISNYITFRDYLSFVLRLTLVFGVGFLLPIFIVLLNAVGVLRHETLSSARRWVIVGIFVFGAVATPTGDPVTLMLLATPMWLLFEAAVLICRIWDRRRDSDPIANLSPDEATPDDALDRIGRVDDEDDS